MLKTFLSQEFRIGFFTGVGIHLIMLFGHIRLLRFECLTPGDCSDIFLYDMPISLFYFAFPDGLLIFFSAILGSALWGFWFWGLLRLLLRLFGR